MLILFNNAHATLINLQLDGKINNIQNTLTSTSPFSLNDAFSISMIYDTSVAGVDIGPGSIGGTRYRNSIKEFDFNIAGFNYSGVLGDKYPEFGNTYLNKEYFGSTNLRASQSILDHPVNNEFSSLFPSNEITTVRFISELHLYDTSITDDFLPESFDDPKASFAGAMELLLLNALGEKIEIDMSIASFSTTLFVQTVSVPVPAVWVLLVPGLFALFRLKKRV